MKLIVISSPEAIPNEGHLIDELFEAGLERFHLRKPDYAESQLVALLEQIHPKNRRRMVLHQYHGLANWFGVGGLHYTEKARQATETSLWQQQKASGMTLSTSVHQLDELPQLSPLFDYAFFSPVFDSISKPGYSGVADPGFTLPVADLPCQVIGLGGIDASNVALINDMHFDGAALLGAIWHHPGEEIIRFLSIQDQCKRIDLTY
jgi:thiamine-phosphate pyrophosphorylase